MVSREREFIYVKSQFSVRIALVASGPTLRSERKDHGKFWLRSYLLAAALYASLRCIFISLTTIGYVGTYMYVALLG
jgi:hypothetical protein